MLKFQLKGPFIELHALLKVLGMTENGGQAKHRIREGLVTVNGEKELRPGKKIISGDQVDFQGEIISVL